MNFIMPTRIRAFRIAAPMFAAYRLAASILCNHLMLCCLGLCFALALSPASARNIYVSLTGNDRSDGLSEATSLRTIQAAANITMPGDTVLVQDGTYYTQDTAWIGLRITRAGTQYRPITYTAYPGAHPRIVATANNQNWSMVQIYAPYINFYGFEVSGVAQFVTLQEATQKFSAAQRDFETTLALHAADPNVTIKYPADPRTNNNCIFISATHHVVIFRNIVHDCSASGISAESSDYITIKDNTVYNTSWWTAYDTSGINVHGQKSVDASTGYKIQILQNVVYNSANTVPYYDQRVGNLVPTDGNGIIIDLNQRGGAYLGRTLISRNTVYSNGGAGINLNGSSHIDVFNNTAYMNNTCPVVGSNCGALNDGQIQSASSTDVNIYNNIAYAPKGQNVINIITKKGQVVSEDNNLFFNDGGNTVFNVPYHLGTTPYTGTFSHNLKDIVTDPKFVHGRVSGRQVTRADLKLQDGSPAINRSTNTLDDGTTVPVEATCQAVNLGSQ